MGDNQISKATPAEAIAVTGNPVIDVLSSERDRIDRDAGLATRTGLSCTMFLNRRAWNTHSRHSSRRGHP